MADDDRDTKGSYPYDELRYALSDPASLSDDERRKCGAAEKRRQTRNYAIGYAIVFAVGLVILAVLIGIASEDDVVELVFGFVVTVVGLIGGVVTGVQTKRKDPLEFVVDGVRRTNRKLERTRSSLAKRMHAEMDNPGRPIYKDFYLEWQALRERGVNPQTFVNGCRHRGTRPVDILVDGTAGKVAVCSYYSASVIGVYDAEKITGCELRNNGAVVHRAGTEDAASRGTENGSAAGGAVAADSGTSRRKRRTEEKPDDYRVVILYDGPDTTDMSFEFGGNRALAENAYRTFAALVKSGAGQADEGRGTPFRPPRERDSAAVGDDDVSFPGFEI